VSAEHLAERRRQQQQVAALTGRVSELEQLVQEKEKERKQAALEVQGFKAALQRQ
jgi:hypothetical protein